MDYIHSRIKGFYGHLIPECDFCSPYSWYQLTSGTSIWKLLENFFAVIELSKINEDSKTLLGPPRLPGSPKSFS